MGEWDGDGAGSARLNKIVFTADGDVALHYNSGQYSADRRSPKDRP
ncbi:hypothetical protein SALBM311S_08555 [Streptomyces alboniger]